MSPRSPGARAVYSFLSRYTAEQFVDMALKVLNTVCMKRGRDNTVIADCTDTDVAPDLNWFPAQDQEGRPRGPGVQVGLLPIEGLPHHIGMKLVPGDKLSFT